MIEAHDLTMKYGELFAVKELELNFGAAVIYRKNGYLSPAARRFIEILKATAKEISAGR